MFNYSPFSLKLLPVRLVSLHRNYFCPICSNGHVAQSPWCHSRHVLLLEILLFMFLPWHQVLMTSFLYYRLLLLNIFCYFFLSPQFHNSGVSPGSVLGPFLHSPNHLMTTPKDIVLNMVYKLTIAKYFHSSLTPSWTLQTCLDISSSYLLHNLIRSNWTPNFPPTPSYLAFCSSGPKPWSDRWYIQSLGHPFNFKNSQISQISTCATTTLVQATNSLSGIIAVSARLVFLFLPYPPMFLLNSDR